MVPPKVRQTVLTCVLAFLITHAGPSDGLREYQWHTRVIACDASEPYFVGNSITLQDLFQVVSDYPDDNEPDMIRRAKKQC